MQHLPARPPPPPSLISPSERQAREKDFHLGLWHSSHVHGIVCSQAHCSCDGAAVQGSRTHICLFINHTVWPYAWAPYLFVEICRDVPVLKKIPLQLFVMLWLITDKWQIVYICIYINKNKSLSVFLMLPVYLGNIIL